MADPVSWYDSNAMTLASCYEGVKAEAVHGWLLERLPRTPATVLDVGAGKIRAFFDFMTEEIIRYRPLLLGKTRQCREHVSPYL
jgi:hypothetical protein